MSLAEKLRNLVKRNYAPGESRRILNPEFKDVLKRIYDKNSAKDRLHSASDKHDLNSSSDSTQFKNPQITINKKFIIKNNSSSGNNTFFDSKLDTSLNSSNLNTSAFDDTQLNQSLDQTANKKSFTTKSRDPSPLDPSRVLINRLPPQKFKYFMENEKKSQEKIPTIKGNSQKDLRPPSPSPPSPSILSSAALRIHA